MTKPLIFVKTKVKIDNDSQEMDSWDLVAFGECPIMHAAWNPLKQLLVCQFSSIKENFVDIPKQTKTGKVNFQQSRVEQYYRLTMYDKEAIQHILDTYVSNYDGQEWELKVEGETEEVVPKQSNLEKI